jgi:hypothetical protein
MPIQTAADSISNSAGSPYGFKNRVINGAMVIDQRNAGSALAAGTSAAGAYTMDRWASYTGTGSLWQMQRVSTGNLDFPFAKRTQRIAGQTSTSAIYVAQIIESINTYGLAGQTVTLSFYVTAGSNYSGGSSFGFQLVNGTVADEGMSSMNSGSWTGGAYPGTTLTPTTTRTRITYTTTLGSSVQEIAVRFYWAGSGTAGANDFVDITGVQLELGSQATAFDYRPFGAEFALCQRYFECNLSYGTTISNFTGGNNSAGVRAMYVSGNSGGAQGWNHDWKVPKRTTPTVTLYSSSSPYAVGTIANATSPTVTNLGTNSAFIYANGNNMYFNFIVDAEL